MNLRLPGFPLHTRRETPRSFRPRDARPAMPQLVRPQEDCR